VARAQGNDSQTGATAPGEDRASPRAVSVGAGTLGDTTTGQSGGEAPAGPHNPPGLLRPSGVAVPRTADDGPSSVPAAVFAACDAIADPDRRAACRAGRHR
jgi:hypothetical protein